MNRFSSLTLAIFVISSCSDMPFEAIVPAVRTAFVGVEKLEITEEFYNAQEYSFANVRIGRNISAILVLESIIDDTYVWTSSGGKKIHTFNGKIVKTSDLERNVELYNFSSFSLEGDDNFQYEAILSNPSAFLEINSEILFDESKDLYIEKMSSKVLTWKNENIYKINKDGLVIYSNQVFHPFEPVIEIEFYYK